MKTIELTPQSPSLEDLLEMAKKEEGLTLTKAGQPVAQVIPLSEKPRERIAPVAAQAGPASGRLGGQRRF